MKAEEFMIGDLVHPIEMPDIVCQVRPEDYVNLVEYDPIHLTPEILEKNGFEWHNEEAKYFPSTWCYGEFMLEPIVDGKLFLIVSRSDYDDEETNYTPFTIKYVHELQHALRLCRTEKKIEML
jgi:hypothetical protein